MFRSEADEEITKVWVLLSSIACFTFKTEEANKQKYLQGKVFVLAFFKANSECHRLFKRGRRKPLRVTGFGLKWNGILSEKGRRQVKEIGQGSK